MLFLTGEGKRIHFPIAPDFGSIGEKAHGLIRPGTGLISPSGNTRNDMAALLFGEIREKPE